MLATFSPQTIGVRMKIRGVITAILGNVVFMGPAPGDYPECVCGECPPAPSVHLSQKDLHVHISDLNVGDKLETATESSFMYDRVAEFSEPAVSLNDLLGDLQRIFAAGPDFSHGGPPVQGMFGDAPYGGPDLYKH
jgi:hypothetical protein